MRDGKGGWAETGDETGADTLTEEDAEEGCGVMVLDALVAEDVEAGLRTYVAFAIAFGVDDAKWRGWLCVHVIELNVIRGIRADLHSLIPA